MLALTASRLLYLATLGNCKVTCTPLGKNCKGILSKQQASWSPRPDSLLPWK